ncbi:hypothetical protein BRCH_04261 [Candidatus Burkholderia brachyanthoides]|nr:hypothetical protein BRCH_04261 [Candidatus Burkholderia brachyanthoides]
MGFSAMHNAPFERINQKERSAGFDATRIVYGTLRAGEINDINRAAGADRHGLRTGRLFDFGSYPGLVLDEHGAPVRGDVYQIEDALVPVLDEIEEVYPGVEGLFPRVSYRLHVHVALEDAQPRSIV